MNNVEIRVEFYAQNYVDGKYMMQILRSKIIFDFESLIINVKKLKF